jgi:hypothetical protein
MGTGCKLKTLQRWASGTTSSSLSRFHVRRIEMNLRSFALTVAAGLLALAPAAMNADTPGAPSGVSACAQRSSRCPVHDARFRRTERRTTPETGRSRGGGGDSRDRLRCGARQKGCGDHPRVDASLVRRGRFGKTVELLPRADLAREEDNGRAAGWRNMAFQHINEALENMHRAAVVMHRDHEFGL